ncbi:DUF3576 domain-containing protein [Sulfitobacter sp. 1151]|uniref:DUF3576 domain-containing protein n=2 Tax=Parasulfitobacter algicola TaxID=2614809 RepID=A0ABX2ITV8_9RHOB|nr:DUF3576 domain-containing protein [Sulfitobacter algicola]NSX53799.1 DUF3576 domain-containing protein [Sulfitobacter algicola]
MRTANLTKVFLILGLGVLLAGCGDTFRNITEPNDVEVPDDDPRVRQSTVWDLFDNNQDPNTAVAVNKYLWDASLDVLNFMPVQTADPFSGVIVMGYGTPPGGSRAYRATVFVRDPALDARSLSISLQTRSGPASIETVRAIEDAIMTRARQLRLEDSRL